MTYNFNIRFEGLTSFVLGDSDANGYRDLWALMPEAASDSLPELLQYSRPHRFKPLYPTDYSLPTVPDWYQANKKNPHVAHVPALKFQSSARLRALAEAAGGDSDQIDALFDGMPAEYDWITISLFRKYVWLTLNDNDKLDRPPIQAPTTGPNSIRKLLSMNDLAPGFGRVRPDCFSTDTNADAGLAASFFAEYGTFSTNKWTRDEHDADIEYYCDQTICPQTKQVLATGMKLQIDHLNYPVTLHVKRYDDDVVVDIPLGATEGGEVNVCLVNQSPAAIVDRENYDDMEDGDEMTSCILYYTLSGAMTVQRISHPGQPDEMKYSPNPAAGFHDCRYLPTPHVEPQEANGKPRCNLIRMFK